MDLSCKMLFGHILGLGLGLDLILHFVLNVTALSLLLANYLDNEEKNAFSVGTTINAAAFAFTAGGTLISIANIIGDWDVLKATFKYDDEEKKESLQNDYFNFLRNLMTSFSLVLITMGNGQDATDITRVAMWLIVVQRLIDVGLDLNNPFKLACDNMKGLEDQLRESAQTEDFKKGNNFQVKQILVAFCLAGVLGLQGWHLSDSESDLSKVNLSSSERDDEFYQLMIFILTGLHLFLILVNMILNMVESCKGGYMKLVGFNEKECEDRDIYGLNSIPMVTKTVFTANLFFLSLLAGEHIEDNKSVSILIYSAIAMGLSDIVARNII